MVTDFAINSDNTKVITKELKNLWPEQCHIKMPNFLIACRTTHGYYFKDTKGFAYEIEILLGEIISIHKSSFYGVSEYKLSDYCKRCLNKNDTTTYEWCDSCIKRIIKFSKNIKSKPKTKRRILTQWQL